MPLRDPESRTRYASMTCSNLTYENVTTKG